MRIDRCRMLRPAAAALLSCIALAGCVVEPARPGYYYGGEYVAAAPPPPQAEMVGVAPAPGYFWIGGFWGWRGGQHVWEAGHWEAPREGYRWVPHAWVHEERGWRANPGHWEHERR